MENFRYNWPTRIIFGKGTEEKVGEETRKYGKKVLVHYGSGSIKKSGLYDKVVASLKNNGVSFVELGGVVPNPRIELVYDGIELCRKERVDFILAVGGGSVIDSTKAIAAGLCYDGDVWEMFENSTPVEKAVPVGVVLTIPAAGSEASQASVINNNAKKKKNAIKGELALRPKFAIMNPELTFTLPNYQTASGVADMLAHIFERYFTNTEYADLSDKLCEATMRSIIKNARIVAEDGKNYDARAEIMWAGAIAHQGLLGMGRVEDWATHRIEHQLSLFYDVTHGAGLAVVFPAWMKYVYKHDVKRFAQFAEEVWGVTEGNDEEKALKGISEIRKFFKSIGLPITLKEMDIREGKLSEMAEIACGGGSIGNFVKLEAKDVLEIYKSVLE